ncbi:helix-turn-helix transcriptional regulator [Actinomadura graeca]|uniref:Helix-turn-helix transcriptional regulator n=1 Tax=Actinomadura graeca TaxID=2750812 RepID=A0ABX8QT56_9ACTN|nr:TetR/AcrR family transcriptional regulator [Actinomadura graeca]QXJ22011.1 helix-turn-helix transcriptional regulator [Actinomadura graeca]
MTPGLRELKRARTRAHIAAAAARLFAERGYENTAVVEIARAAEVSEQTVYNHFPVKQDLVLDRFEEVRARFAAAVRDRAPGTAPAEALRPEALALAGHVRSMGSDELRGTIGHLALHSPEVHRLVLQSTDRLAGALAAVITETTDPAPPPAIARLRGMTLAWISQTVIEESGPLIRDGLTPEEIAVRLSEIVTAMLDELRSYTAD